jgi:Fibronectin type III domain
MKSFTFRRLAVGLAAFVTVASVVALPVSQASAATATHMVFTTQPGNSTGGALLTTQPTVSMEDGTNAVDTTDTTPVTLSITPGTGTAGAALTGCTGTTTLGVAAFTGCRINTAGTGYTLTAANGVLTNVISTPFNVTVGTASHLAYTAQPAGAVGGTAFTTQPTVTIQDAGGNTVTTDTNAIALAITGGTGTAGAALTGCTGTTTLGVAAFTGCKINRSGTGYTLTASDATDVLTQPSTAFNVTVGAATQLVFTVEPAGATGGTAFGTQPTVAIQDAGGNTVTTDTNAITLTITGGTGTAGAALTGCTGTTTLGVAAFTGCKINTAGTGYTLTATDTPDGPLTAASTALNVTVGAAAQLAFTRQPGNGTPGIALNPQPVVTIRDAGGNTVTTDTNAITMAITNGTGTAGATLTGPCTGTTTAGVATFTGCTVNSAGAGYTLTATDTLDALNQASATFNVGLSVSCSATGLTAAASNAAVTLTWTAPSCNGGSAITGYKIFEGSATGAESTTAVNGTLDPSAGYVVTGLTNGTKYYFTVQAVNGVGSSASSNEASASPNGPAATPTGGYWEAASDGGVFSFGNAQSFGSAASLPLNHPVVGMTPTHDRQGYWLVASDGGIFNYGDAHFYGSTGGMTLNKPIVGMAVTPDGGGYWLVASDGGIFAYGDAHFYGSTGGMALNKPIVGMAANPAGAGYWLVASDGGIFNYGGAAFKGSTGGLTLNKPIVGMAAAPDGGGYWLVASDGGIFNYGSAGFYGSTGGIALNKPVIGMG